MCVFSSGSPSPAVLRNSHVPLHDRHVIAQGFPQNMHGNDSIATGIETCVYFSLSAGSRPRYEFTCLRCFRSILHAPCPRIGHVLIQHVSIFSISVNRLKSNTKSAILSRFISRNRTKKCVGVMTQMASSIFDIFFCFFTWKFRRIVLYTKPFWTWRTKNFFSHVIRHFFYLHGLQHRHY